MIGKCFLSYLLIAGKNQLIEAAALPSSNLTLQGIKNTHNDNDFDSYDQAYRLG